MYDLLGGISSSLFQNNDAIGPASKVYAETPQLLLLLLLLLLFMDVLFMVVVVVVVVVVEEVVNDVSCFSHSHCPASFPFPMYGRT